VRHPFCTGYVIASLAAPIAIDHWLSVALAAPLIVVAIAAALREEHVWISAPARAEEYRAYRRTTGMFIPRIGRPFP
jgi:protein-S-isoprenylcysteine O-methyltransferase Ste14